MIELSRQVPALLVLVYLVVQFTKTIREVVGAFRDELGDFKKAMRESASAIERNTEVLSHVKFVLQEKRKEK